ncbi:MAG: DUF4446 family protein [Candidatus Pacebacteria bacterium]|nr:DUF4446 family protein [Candidatus Paceibacterota bacterium]
MFSFIKKNKKIENVEEAIEKIEKLEAKIKELSYSIEKIEKENEENIQKVKLLRYNPFNEMGGDQSFTLALLNKNNSGAIITSIFNQEKSRVFGKQIIKGTSTYPLSKEEEDIIKNYGKED